MTTRTRSAARARPEHGVNLAVVRGRLSRDPVERVLPSGDHIANYEVTVRPPGGDAVTVPVARMGAPPAGASEGAEVVVVGQVRRRFFRAGGRTASRTEVLADSLTVVRRRAAAVRALRRALGRLDDAVGAADG